MNLPGRMTFTGGASAGAGASSELFAKPASPNADDDEFEGTIDGAWNFHNNASALTSSGAPTVYADVSAGTDYRLVHDSTDRPSWVLFQPEGINVQMHKSITLGTNTLIWARIGLRMWHGVPVNNDIAIALSLWADAAGTASTTDSIRFFMTETDTSIQTPRLLIREGNVSVLDERMSGSDVDPDGPHAFEYLAIHKIGSEYHFWIGSAAGDWCWWTSHTYAGTALVRVGIYTGTAGSDVNPGTPLSMCDFIRRVDTTDFVL